MPKRLLNRFEERIRDLPGHSNFEKLYNFYLSIISHKEERNFSIRDRLKSNKYFYFPEESEGSNWTCFEKSLEVYLGALAIYPESNPRLLMIEEGKRGAHAGVIFNNHNQLYWIDSSYQIFDPFAIIDGRIITEGFSGNYSSVKIDKISEVPDSYLRNVIAKLRSPKGMVPFLSGGGQIIERNMDAYRPYTIFAKYDGEVFTSELRFVDFLLDHHSALRKKFYPKDNKALAELLVYDSENWGELKGEYKICWSNMTDAGETLHLNQRRSLVDLEIRDLDTWLLTSGFHMGSNMNLAKDFKKNMKNVFLFDVKTRKNSESSLKEPDEPTPEWREDFSKIPGFSDQTYNLERAKNVSDNFYQKYLDSVLFYSETPKRWKKVETWREFRKKDKIEAKGVINQFGKAFFETSKKERKLQFVYETIIRDRAGFTTR